MTSNKKTTLILMGTMSSISILAVFISSYLMYMTAFKEKQQVLIHTVQNKARTFEAVAKADLEHYINEHNITDYNSAFQHTFKHFHDADIAHHEAGKTAGFAMATIEDGCIVYLLPHQDAEHKKQFKVPLEESEKVIPMREALKGNSGVMIATDINGNEVLAAYEPVDLYKKLALVAQIEIKEIRDPFIKTSIYVITLILILIFIGANVLINTISNIFKEVYRSDAKYKNLVEQIPAITYMAKIDDDFKIFYVSPQVEELLGISREIFLKNQKWRYEHIYDADRENMIQELPCNKDDEIMLSIEYRMRTADGHKKWFLDRGNVVKDDTGKPHFFQGVMFDITELKQAQENLLKKDKMLIAQSRQAAMGDMIAMIAHQWRQPLSIIGMISNNIRLDMELDSLSNDKLKDSLIEIDTETQYLSKTIDDFRNFFKPDKEKERVLISKVLKDTMNIIGQSLLNNGVEIKEEILFDPKLHIFSKELQQVFLNILSNAKDAMNANDTKKKMIEIRISKIGSYLSVRFCDNGGGFTKDIENKIFEPYFTTKEESGTGLGLHISKTIIEKSMKGKIDHWNEGDGACFAILLPLEDDL